MANPNKICIKKNFFQKITMDLYGYSFLSYVEKA
jgi:hypothetical protein